MLPLLSHASLELNRKWSVAWHSLMTIMVIMFTPKSKLMAAETDRPEERGMGNCSAESSKRQEYVDIPDFEYI